MRRRLSVVMAVLLYREGERKSQALSPKVRSLPRLTVRNQPVVAAPHWKGALRARTAVHVSYTHPEREQVWRESFERYSEEICLHCNIRLLGESVA